MNPPADEQNASDARGALNTTSEGEAGDGEGGEVQPEKEESEADRGEGDGAPWVLTFLTSVAVTMVGVLGAITALFVGRASHGLTVGRLSLAPVRIDSHGRIAVRIRNTGDSGIFSVRIEGACRIDAEAHAFRTLMLEKLAAGAEMVEVFSTVSGGRYVSELAQARFAGSGIALRALYTDHADRRRSEVRDYAHSAFGFRLIRSRTRLRWRSIG